MADLTRIFWNNRADAAAALVQQSKIGDGAEINTTPLFGGDLSRTLQRSGLALLDLGERGVLTILGVGKRNATLLTRDLGSRRLRTEELLDLVVAPHSANLSLPASLSGRIAPRARRTLLCERLREVRLGTVTMLTRHPGTNFVRQLRDAGLIRTLGAFATAHALETMLWLIVWWAAGKAALSGRIDSGWMQGWGLLIAVLVPVRMWATWSQGKFSVGASGLLKQRLLAGALRLEPGQVAQEGAGKFFSRVTEADSLETLALSGGLMSAVSVLELAVAAAVLGLGANGASLIALLALWIGLTAIAMWRYARARARWTTARLALTHDAVEQMSGHRTRLAQEPPERRHTNEDAVLENYHALSDTMDRWGVRLTALVPRGWLLAGLAGLLPAFLGGANPADLAIGLGGILLAWQALRRLSAGATHLAGAALAWKSVAPLFDAAGRAASETKPPRHAPDSAPARTVLDAADLAFRYREGGRAVLDGVDLRIERGDWVLLEGASGGGKSTLVSMLAGLRQPSAGLLTSGGLDRRALGEQGWRKRIAAAPQYHENHILTGSLAFNLLMGRTWPPSQQDLTEAAALCRELGLGPLLERMPAGLHQVVGETGWQLSQGERSRVFLARAILQNSEMVILDESFAALDPENLRRSMECALQRTNTLLVVAHP